VRPLGYNVIEIGDWDEGGEMAQFLREEGKKKGKKEWYE
jgi:hypothetical protein